MDHAVTDLPGPPQRRYFRFTYPILARAHEKLRPFKTRDGAAFNELTAPLPGLGWEYGSLIFNYPNDPNRPRSAFDFLHHTDLIVLATRPPMHDSGAFRRRLPRSHTCLERSIFPAIQPYISHCDRSQVTLGAVGTGYARADFSFSLYSDARLVEYRSLAPNAAWQRVDAGKYLTIGFFLYLPRIDDFGCGLLASFSMGGLETLIWNRIVRTRYPTWLEKPRFAVCELDLGLLPDQPVSLDFVNDTLEQDGRQVYKIGVTPLLDCPL